MKSHARWEGGGANIEVQSWQWRRGGKGARRGEIKEVTKLRELCSEKCSASMSKYSNCM